MVRTEEETAYCVSKLSSGRRARVISGQLCKREGHQGEIRAIVDKLSGQLTRWTLCLLLLSENKDKNNIIITIDYVLLIS